MNAKLALRNLFIARRHRSYAVGRCYYLRLRARHLRFALSRGDASWCIGDYEP